MNNSTHIYDLLNIYNPTDAIQKLIHYFIKYPYCEFVYPNGRNQLLSLAESFNFVTSFCKCMVGDAYLFDNVKKRIETSIPDENKRNIAYIEFLYNVLDAIKRAEESGNSYLAKATTKLNNAFEEADRKLEVIRNNLHLTKIIDPEKGILLVETSLAEQKAAKIVGNELNYKLLKYHHFTLTDNLEEKREILRLLSNILEPQKRLYNKGNNKLGILDDFFNLVNKCEIRHGGNTDEKSVNYVKYWASLSPIEKSKYYDNIFDLAILCINMTDYSNNTADKLRVLKEKCAQK